MRARKLWLSLGLSVWFLLPVCGRADQGHGSNLLRLHFVDVGHGDAIWIQCPAGNGAERGQNIIIDGGPDRGDGNRLLTYLKSYRLPPGQVIDYLIVTHPHDDHYPGAIDVLEKYDVLNILDSGYTRPVPPSKEKRERFQVFLDAAMNEKVKGKPARFISLRSQSAPALACGEAEVSILYHYRDNLKGMGSDDGTRKNNASTVLRLVYGSHSFLLMGDAEGKERDATADKPPRYVEELLLKQPGAAGLLRSTVLKAAHHGSESGSTLPFLRAVDPEVVVVMAGSKVFGPTKRTLPDASVLRRYKQVRPDVAVVRTDQGDVKRSTYNDADGDDILIYTDGETLEVQQAVGNPGRRRWKLIKTLQ